MKIVSLLDRLAAITTRMAERAAALDAAASFPAEDIGALAAAGALAAPLPRRLGGLGWGTAPDEADGLREALRLLGRGHLATGRLFEAHVNALRLIIRYGDAAVIAGDVHDGRMFALWVTDPPGGGLRLHAGRLHGERRFCSGAGHVTRAVVTARDPDGAIRLAVARLDASAVATPLAEGATGGGLAGMRAAATGSVQFDATPATPFGAPDDYLREPDFSTGAWRTSAVTLGGLEALLAETAAQLRARRRTGDPHQQARFGRAKIAVETARLWVVEASRRGEAADADPEAAVAFVNLARLAVEACGLEAMEAAQRALGLAAFVRPNPVERLCRDLAVYLRQPAPDAALCEAASHYLRG
jgi:alkylation response protein AidB-like acyl-CoA dehydrogenase